MTTPDPKWLEDVDLDGLGDWKEAERPWLNTEWQRQRGLIVAELEGLRDEERFTDAIGAIADLNLIACFHDLTPACPRRRRSAAES